VTKDEIITKLLEENASFKLLLNAALARIAELEAQLKTDSTNSGNPPSSDGLKKKPAFPRLRGGRRGGKLGHKVNTLKMVEEPDHVELHDPKLEKCTRGCSLLNVKTDPIGKKRQVFDLPPQLLEVTEHQLGVKHCPGCGQKHQGKFSTTVVAPVQYGSGVRALINLFNVEQSLSVGWVGELFSSLTGYALNENTIVSAVGRMAEELEDDTEVIKQRVLTSAVTHAYETGARVAGKLHWGHDLVTELYTYFFVSEKRGRIALESYESITDEFSGILIHDCWASYFNLSCSNHGLCGAHLLRELRNLSENYERK
jgi:transposase